MAHYKPTTNKAARKYRQMRLAQNPELRDQRAECIVDGLDNLREVLGSFRKALIYDSNDPTDLKLDTAVVVLTDLCDTLSRALEDEERCFRPRKAADDVAA